MKFILVDDTDEFCRILRVSRISGLLKTVRPSFEVSRFKVKKKLVPVSVSEEIRVVSERLLRSIVLSEALPLGVIIVIDLGSCPLVVTLDAEMVVCIYRKLLTAVA